jgi:hypothetical protein
LSLTITEAFKYQFIYLLWERLSFTSMHQNIKASKFIKSPDNVLESKLCGYV